MQATLIKNGQVVALASDEWRAEIEKTGCKGLIFDCDGTLVESSGAHCQAMQAAAAEQGFLMPRDWYFARTGLDRVTLFQEFRRLREPGLDWELAVQTSIDKYSLFLRDVHAIEEVVRLFWALKDRCYPLAIATNAEREIAIQSLAAVGMSSAADALVTISDVVAPKPDPEMFLKAAKLLDLGPDEVIVLEDSSQGVEAALAAGMLVLKVAPKER